METIRTLTGFLFVLIYSANCFALPPGSENKTNATPASVLLTSQAEFRLGLHQDSIHLLNLRYPDKNRGLRPLIAPSLLISAGTAIHFMPAVKENMRDFINENLEYHGSLDDYAQYSPFAAVYLLNLAGIKGQNNFGNRSALSAKSILLSSFLTYRMKVWVNATRPNLEAHSFPSGHTSTAFTFAHFMHREYGERNLWYSIGAYSGATAVGIMRLARNAHWLSDVLMGAGIGILSTEVVYLTHQYKWDNDHLKRFDIFPFQFGKQKGLTLVCTF